VIILLLFAAVAVDDDDVAEVRDDEAAVVPFAIAPLELSSHFEVSPLPRQSIRGGAGKIYILIFLLTASTR
jgi:hypothetical protein